MQEKDDTTSPALSWGDYDADDDFQIADVETQAAEVPKACALSDFGCESCS